MPSGNEIFVVRGRARFPVEMLRYDCCWPAGSIDVEAIKANLAAPGRPEEPVTIALKSRRGPTREAWASYGWDVLDDDAKRR